MGSMKRKAKSLLNQRMRVGVFTLPIWVVGLAFVANRVWKSRQQRSLSAAS